MSYSVGLAHNSIQFLLIKHVIDKGNKCVTKLFIYKNIFLNLCINVYRMRAPKRINREVLAQYSGG